MWGGEGANQGRSETTLHTHGGKVQGCSCQATEEVHEARLGRKELPQYQQES